MTADAKRAGSTRLGGALVPVLALAAIGVVLRFTFVDLLTRTTGTWIGGVESPHRADTDGAGA